ncbi:hypothetical protein GPDM_00990 [Planococcus donghaensis MPA1U2]|uniref:Uncharacterized protein n=1 Tax=Planococcus donghaensis MPA1U2 TaxID=933115 RepID=E7RCN4_9BACL|nr:hypothetical protein [Planococcus donghaensis]EGA91399.1 hypothetical protein GPDM_00990 [Planococcus donghaensis MPA1U2]
MKPTFHCGKCHHELEEPIMLPYHQLLGIARTFNDVKESMKRKRIQEYIWGTYGPTSKKSATLKGIEEYKRYISMEDTMTFCKRCAFLWDKKGKKACEICKETLISLDTHDCYKCQTYGH